MGILNPRAMGGRPWESALDAIAGLEVVEPDGEPFAGGMRKRLGVQVADGVEVFVVNRLEQKMAELQALLLLPGP